MPRNGQYKRWNIIAQNIELRELQFYIHFTMIFIIELGKSNKEITVSQFAGLLRMTPAQFCKCS